MPKVPIIMPQLGESVTEATILRFKAQVGEPITSDQEIIEVETNKAVMGVTTPCDGVIAEFTAEVNQTYQNGAVLGYIEASEEDCYLKSLVENLARRNPTSLELLREIGAGRPGLITRIGRDS